MFVCSNCGEGSSTWIGRCPACKEWNTFKEMREAKEGRAKGEKKQSLAITSFKNIASQKNTRKKTGLFELDRVLGGGIVPGSIILLTGEPGVGKSTLLLQALKGLKTLYISGEESAEQVKERAERLEVDLDQFLFSDTLQVEGIVSGVQEQKDLDVIVIDSIQTVYSRNADSAPGSVTQLRESAAQLIRLGKENKIPLIMVGHVTKDGDIAGPKTLEHMVDVVLSFEGERVSHFRILRGQKNRFGSTDEIGIFEMKKEGLVEVNNPLAFVDEEMMKGSVPGKAIVGVMEGKRPLFYEVQTLASTSYLSMPRRVVKGVDYNKVLLLLAVIEKQLKLSLSKYDVFVNVVGGVDVKSTAADLGIAASIISSVKNIPLSHQMMFTGELGLLGEVRNIYGQDKILSEAKRLQFAKTFSTQNIKSMQALMQELMK